jgi:hypothetical protein
MKVDIHVANAERLGSCGPGEGAAAQISGFDALQFTENFDPPHPSGLVRSITLAGVHDGHCYIILGGFAQKTPDEETFFKIVNSIAVQD